MAQIRLRDYREPLTSFTHNLMQLRNRPGRFMGFDTVVQTGTLVFNLAHTAGAQTYKDQNQNTLGPIGVIMSRQGVYIIEDGNIGPFTIDTNAGNTSDRIDLIVCNHQYVVVSGGQNATYALIKGPIGNTSPPGLTNPNYQVIVGRLYIPAGATNINQCTYTREKSPDSGDGPDARINEVNKFNTFNQFNFSPTIYNSTSYTTNYGGVIAWTLKADGNVFDVNPGAVLKMDAIRVGKDPVQNGTEITVQINQLVTIRSGLPLTAPALGLGFSNIIIPAQFGNSIVDHFTSRVIAITPTNNSPRWAVTFLKAGDQWIVTNVQANQDLSFKRGMIIDAAFTNTDLIDFFDGTGLGKNLYLGWAMCNGANGTIDMRGRFTKMTTDVQNDLGIPLEPGIDPIPFNQAGGSNRTTLTVAQLPPHNHAITGSNIGNNAGGGSVPAVNYTGFESAGFTEGTGNGESFDNQPAFKTLYKIQRII